MFPQSMNCSNAFPRLLRFTIRKKRIDSADSGKAILVRMVSMLVGLIRSTSASRVYEESPGYGTEQAE